MSLSSCCNTPAEPTDFPTPDGSVVYWCSTCRCACDAVVTVAPELLIKAAEQVEEDVEVHVRSYGIVDEDGALEFDQADEAEEYNRLLDLARRLREAAG